MKYKLKKAFLASKVVTESSCCFHFRDDCVTGVGWKVEEAPLMWFWKPMTYVTA